MHQGHPVDASEADIVVLQGQAYSPLFEPPSARAGGRDLGGDDNVWRHTDGCPFRRWHSCLPQTQPQSCDRAVLAEELLVNQPTPSLCRPGRQYTGSMLHTISEALHDHALLAMGKAHHKSHVPTERWSEDHPQASSFEPDMTESQRHDFVALLRLEGLEIFFGLYWVPGDDSSSGYYEQRWYPTPNTEDHVLHSVFTDSMREWALTVWSQEFETFASEWWLCFAATVVWLLSIIFFSAFELGLFLYIPWFFAPFMPLLIVILVRRHKPNLGNNIGHKYSLLRRIIVPVLAPRTRMQWDRRVSKEVAEQMRAAAAAAAAARRQRVSAPSSSSATLPGSVNANENDIQLEVLTGTVRQQAEEEDEKERRAGSSLPDPTYQCNFCRDTNRPCGYAQLVASRTSQTVPYRTGEEFTERLKDLVSSHYGDMLFTCRNVILVLLFELLPLIPIIIAETHCFGGCDAVQCERDPENSERCLTLWQTVNASTYQPAGPQSMLTAAAIFCAEAFRCHCTHGWANKCSPRCLVEQNAFCRWYSRNDDLTY